MKQQLELHRDKASCRDCHKKIDPYGIVFENYDAVGRFQEKYKTKMLINASATLPDGTEVDGIKGIKSYILEAKREEFARSLVTHLFAYAHGRHPTLSDEDEINRIVDVAAADNLRFQTIIKELILGPSFNPESMNQELTNEN